MKEIILAKCGELVLKGLNRSSFEKTLIRNIKRALQPLGEFDVSIMQSTIYIDKDGGIDDTAAAFSYVRRVFGIAALCRAAVCRKDMEDIKKRRLNTQKTLCRKNVPLRSSQSAQTSGLPSARRRFAPTWVRIFSKISTGFRWMCIIPMSW